MSVVWSFSSCFYVPVKLVWDHKGIFVDKQVNELAKFWTGVYYQYVKYIDWIKSKLSSKSYDRKPVFFNRVWGTFCACWEKFRIFICNFNNKETSDRTNDIAKRLGKYKWERAELEGRSNDNKEEGKRRV